TGYIDARPLTTRPSKSSCYARPDHTSVRVGSDESSNPLPLQTRKPTYDSSPLFRSGPTRRHLCSCILSVGGISPGQKRTRRLAHAARRNDPFLIDNAQQRVFTIGAEAR